MFPQTNQKIARKAYAMEGGDAEELNNKCLIRLIHSKKNF